MLNDIKILMVDDSSSRSVSLQSIARILARQISETSAVGFSAEPTYLPGMNEITYRYQLRPLEDLTYCHTNEKYSWTCQGDDRYLFLENMHIITRTFTYKYTLAFLRHFKPVVKSIKKVFKPPLRLLFNNKTFSSTKYYF